MPQTSEKKKIRSQSLLPGALSSAASSPMPGHMGKNNNYSFSQNEFDYEFEVLSIIAKNKSQIF